MSTQHSQIIRQYSKDTLKYVSYYPEAEPIKTLEDVGFFLSLANRVGDRNQDEFQAVNTFTVGLSFQCPIDRIIQITTTNMLHKQGYMLCSPVIVEPKNIEEVKVDLIKFSDKDDIILPFHKALKATIYPACYHHLKKNKSTAVAIEQVKKEEVSTESDFF
jgi:hypothetical protein